MADGSGLDCDWSVDHAQQHMVGRRCEIGIGKENGRGRSWVITSSYRASEKYLL